MTSTRTYALMEISPEAYAEIADAMKRAQYDHAFMEDGAIDMHGIAVIPEKVSGPPPLDEKQQAAFMRLATNADGVLVDEPVFAPLRASMTRERQLADFVAAVFDPEVTEITEQTILILGKREVDGYTLEDLSPMREDEVKKFPMRITNTEVDYKQKFEETRALLYDLAMGNNFDVKKLDEILKELAL